MILRFMKELYVIVHEKLLHNIVPSDHCYAEDPTAVIKFINRLKKRVGSENYFELEGNASYLPKGLPSPSDDLHILVVGALERRCCLSQTIVLRERGYSADLLQEGCYKGSLPEFPWLRPQQYDEKYPDLFT